MAKDKEYPVAAVINEDVAAATLISLHGRTN